MDNIKVPATNEAFRLMLKAMPVGLQCDTPNLLGTVKRLRADSWHLVANGIKERYAKKPTSEGPTVAASNSDPQSGLESAAAPVPEVPLTSEEKQSRDKRLAELKDQVKEIENRKSPSGKRSEAQDMQQHGVQGVFGEIDKK